jgi:hypothetical protein
VWKTSRIGERPPPEPDGDGGEVEGRSGFNSPFEECAIALDLRGKGIPTVYARAIYVTGSQKVEPSIDFSRYESHKDLRDPDGKPILRADRNYITIRGYFNGPDDWVARQRHRLCRPLDLAKALAGGDITERQYRELTDATLARLRNVGYDGSALEGNDMLLVFDPDHVLMKDAEGRPEVRICSFERIRQL